MMMVKLFHVSHLLLLVSMLDSMLLYHLDFDHYLVDYKKKQKKNIIQSNFSEFLPLLTVTPVLLRIDA
jgi:hypothetical protein